MQNVNYFTKTRGIIQNTCCCLFSTDLNKIFHIKYVYIQYSPQEKIIVEFIKITPFKSLHTLDSVLLPEWSTAVFFCLVIVVHESLVCPDQLNCCGSSEKSFRSHKFFAFPAFLCIWTLSNNDCMILRSIFSHWGQPRDSYATITEGSNAHWCSRRKNHALRGGGGGGAFRIFESRFHKTDLFF